jgi:hypothetical protein
VVVVATREIILTPIHWNDQYEWYLRGWGEEGLEEGKMGEKGKE